MRRSSAVHAFLVVSVAAGLTGCGQRHEAARRCVDENGNFTDDRNCTSPPVGSTHHYSSVYAPAGASNASAGEDSAHSGTVRGVVGGEGAAHAGGSGEGHGGGSGAGE